MANTQPNEPHCDKDLFCPACGSRLPKNNQTGYCDLICAANDDGCDDDFNFYGGPNDYDN